MNGISTTNTDGLQLAMQDLLLQEPYFSRITDVVARDFDGSPEDLETVSYDVARSLELMRIDIHAPRGYSTPQFVVLLRRPPGMSTDHWCQLLEMLAGLSYELNEFGTGYPAKSFNYCTLCHCLTHPRGLCPFSSIEGWNGPGYRSPWITKDTPQATYYSQQASTSAQGRTRDNQRGSNRRGRGRGYDGRGRGGPNSHFPPPPPPPPPSAGAAFAT